MEEKAALRGRLSAALPFAVSLALIATAAALLAPPAARAARYTVSECGWYMGHDAGWSETSGSRLDGGSYCVPPRSRPAFDGVHMTSRTAGTKPVGGARFARWRWTAPDDTTIINVHGSRWQTLRDGFEHRLGGVTRSGFNPDFRFESSDSPRDFKTTFASPVVAFEARLLCARAESKSCATTKPSSASVSSLVFTMDDPKPPTAGISGELTAEGWQRGSRQIEYEAGDQGSGIRFSETSVDGLARIRTEHECTRVTVGGQVRAGRMRPCALGVRGSQTLRTSLFSDGPHQLRHCAFDFSGESGCSRTVTIRTDNTPPAGPRSLQVAGGDGWHRENGFILNWEVPDQGPASPVTGSWLWLGSGGGGTGPVAGTGPDRAEAIEVPGPGEYPVRVWLGDAAGNSEEATAVTATLRFDDVPPTGYLLQPSPGRPEHLQAVVSDIHSGIETGVISIRRRKDPDGQWRDLPTGIASDKGETWLNARLPSEALGTGEWMVRATATDRAGNVFVTTRRDNGSVLTVDTPAKRDTRLTVRLSASGRNGPVLHANPRERVMVTGRLSAGQGLRGERLRVIELPDRGSRQRLLVHDLTTGRDGSFRLWLRPGTNRRVSVEYMGTERHSRAVAGPLRLVVAARIGLRAGPRRLRTGNAVTFSGRVSRGLARVPARGSTVAIQYLSRTGSSWHPVLVARTNQRGRFRAAYRFRYITRSAKITLRAVLLPSGRFPYGGAVSRPVVVRVRG